MVVVKVVVVNASEGHFSTTPKSAEHMTSVSTTLSAVVCQVTVFMSVAWLVPSLVMFTRILELPHTVTAQVKVTCSLPVADSGLTVQLGDVAAKKNIIEHIIISRSQNGDV